LNENGFFELLAQLTKIGEISIEEFEARRTKPESDLKMIA
jgi:hypothetical protein